MALTELNGKTRPLVEVIGTGHKQAVTSGEDALEIRVTLTRPADANAYAAKDVVADSTGAPAPTMLTLANAASKNGGSGLIVGVHGNTSAPAWVARLRLHLYNAALAVMKNDNDPYTYLLADKAKDEGYIDCPPFAPGGTGSDMASFSLDTVRHAYTCAAGSKDLRLGIEILDASAATSEQTIDLIVTVVRLP